MTCERTETDTRKKNDPVVTVTVTEKDDFKELLDDLRMEQQEQG